MSSPFLFTSERLGFRNWKPSDVDLMIEISADEEVMEFFPYVATPEQTRVFIERMTEMCDKKHYCYFAVEELESREFIGFIGLCDQNYEAEFTPCIDIGWRLSQKYWGKGYATEGAKKCLEYTFRTLGLNEIYSTAPTLNKKSISIMEKIGMKKHLEFRHERLKEYQHLESCLCYKIDSNMYLYTD
ncbi:MAG: GNAT family N-acetyltransferase [Crocinitomicaceae bacterium]|nr:GNAT family N-acetyltransferase [Crocinitomicaceae bacterium]